MEERFEALVKENRIGLVGYLSRYVDVGTAEELAADAFVSLWQRMSELHDENLRAYLYASGRNAARNYLRRQGRIVFFEEMPADLPAEDAELDAQLIRDERSRDLHAALRRIHPRYRAVLHLLYFCDMTPAEVGHVLHKSPRQIGNLTYRAKAALRKELGDTYANTYL